jgi:UDP-glucose 4-epimerase
MRILLTGASSFTGYWFARTLAARGHAVVAPLRGAAGSYVDGVRAERVARLVGEVEVVWDTAFGDARFLDLVGARDWDVLCHHAAQVGDYRSPDFDVPAALAANTRALPAVLRAMAGRGAKRVVLTGSVFEADEGAGEEPRQAFSPYGLSKTLTAQVFRYWCATLGMPLAKFVIPNPFGPLEERRFCTHLVETWRAGNVASVRTPAYVRDNIHVDLLALAYARLVEAPPGPAGAVETMAPSGYVETQGQFARRFAEAMEPRLGIRCTLELARQTEFAEPIVRINTHPAAAMLPDWSEAAAWDRYAAAYA